MNLKDKVVVVTGGGSGLGRGTAKVLGSRHGARLAVLDLTHPEWSDEDSPRPLALEVDVTDDAAVGAAIATVLREFGRVDVCINCAGIPGPLRIVDRTGAAAGAAAFAKVIAVNLAGTFHVMSHCVAAMLRNAPDPQGERGVVINTASGAAFEGQAGQSGYAASKAGIVGLTLPAARELSRHGIRVNAVAPGLFDTPMAQAAPEMLARLLDAVEFPKRLGRVEEFAELCAHICANPYLNGECLRIDGAARLPARSW